MKAKITAVFTGFFLLFSILNPITASANDTQLPVVDPSSGIISNNIVAPNASLILTYRVTDDVGCCSTSLIGVYKDSGRNVNSNQVYYSIGASHTRVSGSATDGRYQVSFVAPTSLETGTYYVKVQAIDNFGRYTHLEQVASFIIDKDLPVMVPNSGVFPKSTFNPGESFNFTYQITDNAGCCSYNVVSLWKVSGKNPAGSPDYQFSGASLVSGTQTNGTYQASVQLPPSISLGTWYVKAQARDIATWYTHVEALGSISVVAPTPTPTPSRTPTPTPTPSRTPTPTLSEEEIATRAAQKATEDALAAKRAADSAAKAAAEKAKKEKSKTLGDVNEANLDAWSSIDVSQFKVLPKRLKGVIKEDARLTIENSPYLVSNTVDIAAGVDVYIEPGVEIKLTSSGSFRVKGRLKVAGTSDNFVKFSGKIKSYFSVQGSSAASEIDINHASFSGGGALLAPSGNAGYASFNLRNSQVVNVSDYSYIWYPGASSYIEGNVFRASGGFSVGFRARDYESGKELVFRNNLFIGKSTTGYWVEVWASYGSEVLVTKNSFTRGPYTALRIREGHDNAFMSAYENFWGTTNAQTIGRMILDAEDSGDYEAEIDYSDPLTAPDPKTPTRLFFNF
ncbi:MAG: hypothetical protein F2559_01560 [Actinobacteria bacterium]|uniref:Unannotated protein n=1 Tax=freshwater metagenome TaxID=449393 RepID=A0A6J6E1Q7_9ZZZZ|nr:hypothetical protein [Actinomycetota bacterium]